jgi:ATP-dependent Lon protease
VPKQLKAHGLTEDNLSLSDDTLSAIISYYTRESGVRELERQIATVCRKVATRIVEDKVTTVKVNRSNLDKSLGVKKYHYDEIQNENQVGIATGLAWTPVGGDTLSIEVSIMKGKGNLVLTGQMGDVMKESARAGLSYLRSISEKYEIADDFHEKMDIHIHIPEGAIPKDGPSAGITMATAVLSAITGIPSDMISP